MRLPAPCRWVGHDWERPYFVPIRPRFPSTYNVESPTEMEMEPIRARATVRCRQCPAWRVIDYDGVVLHEMGA